MNDGREFNKKGIFVLTLLELVDLKRRFIVLEVVEL